MQVKISHLLLTEVLLLHGVNLVHGIKFKDIENAFDTLQTWYDPGKGLWIPSTGWWNSASCLTMLADLAAINPTIESKTRDLWNESFTNAQLYNSDLTAAYGPRWGQSIGQLGLAPFWTSNSDSRSNNIGFINDFYDDEGWWALAWIQVYDLTQDLKYLKEAEVIFDDMHAAWGTTPVGGLWWDKQHQYVNAIANELHLSVAAHLANRVTGQRNRYVSIASQSWSWLYNSGMITADNTIKDGLAVGSKPGNTEIVWSYNQGVILSAFTELAKATGTQQYLSMARVIADAGLANLTINGILREPCEGWRDCGTDGAQFKGVFARNLAHLHAASPRSRYAAFLKQNAESLWVNSRDEYNRLGLSWTGPFTEPANASTQCSGMDVLVGALAQLGEWEDGSTNTSFADYNTSVEETQPLGIINSPPVTSRAGRSGRGSLISGKSTHSSTYSPRQLQWLSS